LISHLKNKNERKIKSYPKAKKAEKEAYNAGRVKKHKSYGLRFMNHLGFLESSKVKTIPY